MFICIPTHVSAQKQSARLQYVVGGVVVRSDDAGEIALRHCVTFVALALQVTTLYHLDRPMYLLGYLASLNRVFLIDK